LTSGDTEQDEKGGGSGGPNEKTRAPLSRVVLLRRTTGQKRRKRGGKGNAVKKKVDVPGPAHPTKTVGFVKGTAPRQEVVQGRGERGMKKHGKDRLREKKNGPEWTRTRSLASRLRTGQMRKGTGSKKNSRWWREKTWTAVRVGLDT